MEIKDLLIQVHTYLDLINSKYGNEKELCLYCHSNLIDYSGIVHTKDCVISKLRVYLKDCRLY
jgi:hypothetical protein